MSLDPTAVRANEPGWTPQAKREYAKAQRDARKAEKKAAAKAWRAGVARSWSAFWLLAWNSLGWLWTTSLANIVLVAALGACVGTGLWEWVNTWGGWRDMYPGAGADRKSTRLNSSH